MTKFRRGEIAHIDMDIDGERVASDVKILDVPHKADSKYYVDVFSIRSFVRIAEKDLHKIR